MVFLVRMHLRDDIRLIVVNNETPHLVGLSLDAAPALNLGAVGLGSSFQVNSGCCSRCIQVSS